MLWLLMFLCSRAFADGPPLATDLKKSRFHTHITTTARTLRPGRVAFETFPGGNGQTTFLMNSLSIGILSRWQVGTVPIFYTTRGLGWNANTKVNLVSDKYFQFGLGYSHFRFHVTGEVPEFDGSITRSPHVDLGFGFVAMNYRQPSQRFAFGLNLAYLVSFSNSPLLEWVIRREMRDPWEWGFDTSYDLSRRWTLTVGLSQQRSQILSFHSPTLFGAGSSLTYSRHSRWLTRVTAGFHYIPSQGDVLGMFSFSL